MHRYLIPLTLIFSLVTVLTSLVPAQAQTDELCFEETGYCISGRIRQYWEQNGSLVIFGYPITPQREETIGDWTGQVQWFERNRLELHPENAPPYDVLLGRLGVDSLEQQGRNWFDFPQSAPQEGCLFLEQTQHNICGEFLKAWRAIGLELDGVPGKTIAENLALFGLPLSDAQTETLSDGNQYTVQWFERARAELHPQNDPPFNVQFGLLGRSVLSGAPAEPPPQGPTPPAEPPPQGPTPPAEPPVEGAGWSQVAGTPAGVNFEDVFMLSDSVAWAVGNRDNLGLVYRLSYDGSAWQVAEDFSVGVHLHAIVAIADDNVWAVGENGLIFRRSAENWEIVYNELPGASLQTIQMFGAGEAGYAGGYLRTGDTSEAVLLRYADGSWQRDDSISGEGAIVSLHFAPGGGWAISSWPRGAQIWRYQEGNWNAEGFPPPCGDPASGCYVAFNDVRAISGDEAWIVGSWGATCAACTKDGHYAIHRIDGQWRDVLPEAATVVNGPERTGMPIANPLIAVFFTDANNGLAVGSLTDPETQSPPRPMVYRYQNGTWYNEEVPDIAGGLGAVSMAGTQRALAVGPGGLILSYGYGQ